MLKKTKLLLIIIALIIMLPTNTNQVIASNSHQSDGKLHVSGTAVVTGMPDIAYITVGVETKKSSAADAAQENANRMDSVLTALKGLGLTEQQISTSGYHIYSSTQVINRGTEQEQTITTYHVNNRLNISTKNLEQVGAIIDATIKNGANNIQSVRFDIEDKQAMQLQALNNAVQQGKAKAEVMASAAGITLAGLTSMQENYSTYAPMADSFTLKASALTNSSTPITPGQVEVSATVSMIYWF